MAHILIDGYRVKVDPIDSFISSILLLWSGYQGQARQVPRNVYDFLTIKASLCCAIIFLPVSWALSHVPLIWPEYLGGMALLACIFLGMKPYLDYLRALVGFITCSLLLYYHVTFNATIWGFHVEKYIYYVVIASCLFALWRRFYNWLCWTQIDRLCIKYDLPHYDQNTLMTNYEGYDMHYGEKKEIYSSYQEAVNAEKANQE